MLSAICHQVSAALREEVSSFYQALPQTLPPNSILVNGQRTDLSAATFNIYDLLVSLRAELAVTSKLSALGLPRPLKTQVARIASNVGSVGGYGGGASKQKQVHLLWIFADSFTHSYFLYS